MALVVVVVLTAWLQCATVLELCSQTLLLGGGTWLHLPLVLMCRGFCDQQQHP